MAAPVRFTVRSLMFGVFIVCLSMAFLIHRERSRRVREELLNQHIPVGAAYTVYQNAVLAHEKARSDAILYLEKIGKGGVRSGYAELSKAEEPEDQTFGTLKLANRKALENELAKKVVWEYEQAKLWRQLKELQSMW
jgi:hypothetical protein